MKIKIIFTLLLLGLGLFGCGKSKSDIAMDEFTADLNKYTDEISSKLKRSLEKVYELKEAHSLGFYTEERKKLNAEIDAFNEGIEDLVKNQERREAELMKKWQSLKSSPDFKPNDEAKKKLEEAKDRNKKLFDEMSAKENEIGYILGFRTLQNYLAFEDRCKAFYESIKLP